MATIGNKSKPTSSIVMTGLNNQNQVALKVTMPSDGQITHVGAWMAGNGGGATTKVCVWGSSGNLLRASASFNAPGQSLATGNYADEYHALTSPLDVSNGQVIYIGFSTDPTEARQWGLNGSGTHYRDTSGSAGADASFASQGNSIGAYATYTTNQPPNKPTGLSPKNNVTLIGTDLTPSFYATFSDPDGGNVAAYDLQVDSGSGFTSPYKWNSVNATSGLSGNSLAKAYPGVPPADSALVRGGHYYWRVRARDSDGAIGPWSDTEEFNINDLPVATKVSPAP